jgi:nicotinamide mononucleotide (NMN) deamidase PncC
VVTDKRCFDGDRQQVREATVQHALLRLKQLLA